jgi:mannosylglycoprotein endo-beta-mannosidase
MRYLLTLIPAFMIFTGVVSGQKFGLDYGWKAKRIAETPLSGEELSTSFIPDSTWLDATVPGTVLTTLINNGLVPDPFIGMNNKLIADISETGRDHYAYWFINTFFTQSFQADRQIWIDMRGVNYSCDVYLNGHKLNETLHKGMFLRQRYNITRYISQEGRNVLAVAVWPPDNVGKINGGQGGDGTIARDVTMQYTTGWDWTEPVADRNTGIWDKVAVEITGPVEIRNPYIVTRVPDVRVPGEIQSAATVIISADLHNASSAEVEGSFGAQLTAGHKSKKVKIAPGETVTVTLSEIKIKQPSLWWPNGMGNQHLYEAEIWFATGKDVVSDIMKVKFGVREFTSEFDETIGARIFKVNGQKIFIKGGNWISSDILLRLSPERYDAEVKLHAAMNMNMIRVWGGSITERPEFYEACDKYGLLVWQDLWITGDCNGRWVDPKKADNQEIRRQYPDDHDLFIRSVADQVKMLRNHPSLAIWCGGNEFPPPAGIDKILKDSLFPALDPERFYLSESTGSQLMTNPYGGTGDGPYGIMEPSWFFTFKSFPFNAEIGSVGLPVEETLRKILSPEALVVPDDDNLNEEWRYHKYISYKDFPGRYGEVTDFSDFVRKAQMVNYEQYRSLQEGQNARMWEWYSGMLVWKNQNPWTSLRGQFYDVFLEQNASFYGYMHAAKPFHAQINLDDTTLCIVNSGGKERRDNVLKYLVYDINGKLLTSRDTLISAPAGSVTRLGRIPLPMGKGEVAFVRLLLSNKTNTVVHDESTYWLAAPESDYSALSSVAESALNVEISRVSAARIDLEVTNTGSTPALFVRFRINDIETGQNIVPVIYEDNYLTLMPGERKFIRIDISSVPTDLSSKPLALYWDGLNLKEKLKVF